mmetsp:Transcript_32971/g.105992  ORF Transcript_32971/g.105992 Transcript_32971/m.105992 type:complete len:264 (+) Transcript_32971:579-1370(+)
MAPDLPMLPPRCGGGVNALGVKKRRGREGCVACWRARRWSLVLRRSLVLRGRGFISRESAMEPSSRELEHLSRQLEEAARSSLNATASSPAIHMRWALHLQQCLQQVNMQRKHEEELVQKLIMENSQLRHSMGMPPAALPPGILQGPSPVATVLPGATIAPAAAPAEPFQAYAAAAVPRVAEPRGRMKVQLCERPERASSSASSRGGGGGGRGGPGGGRCTQLSLAERRRAAPAEKVAAAVRARRVDDSGEALDQRLFAVDVE